MLIQIITTNLYRNYNFLNIFVKNLTKYVITCSIFNSEICSYYIVLTINKNLVYMFGDKLPTLYHAAIEIFFVGNSKQKSSIMQVPQ